MITSLKIAYAMFFLGLAAIPLKVIPTEYFLSLSSIIFFIGLVFIGLHFFKNAEELANGNLALIYFYKSSPIILPFVSLVIRYIFKN